VKYSREENFSYFRKDVPEKFLYQANISDVTQDSSPKIRYFFLERALKIRKIVWPRILCLPTGQNY